MCEKTIDRYKKFEKKGNFLTKKCRKKGMKTECFYGANLCLRQSFARWSEKKSLAYLTVDKGL